MTTASERRERVSDDDLIRALYWRVKRTPEEGTLEPAIRTHAQACGLIAFLLNVHPDAVAQSVALAVSLADTTACEHRDTHFDRSLCACGAMHHYCNQCGAAIGCPLDTTESS